MRQSEKGQAHYTMPLSTAWHPGITIIVKTIRPYAVTTFRIDEIGTALEKLWMERKIDLDICA